MMGLSDEDLGTSGFEMFTGFRWLKFDLHKPAPDLVCKQARPTHARRLIFPSKSLLPLH